MPATVTHLRSNDNLLRHHHYHLHQDEIASSMANASIETHPPSRVQTNTVLSPTVTVKVSSEQCGSGGAFFITAVLLDADGGVASGLMGSTTVATGNLVDPSTMSFEFSDLSIATAGQYSIRLDVYSMNDGNGAVLIDQLKTSEISAQ
ncbi:hypothetical protein NQ176_g7267 [Zarea fungicola]|uniref:Uncharacterized protein n=1 Tax=Zarea fungicola TaxID=93591 RepID=A0ACC1N1C6_9HYPO|nr:hypothetical protein NQ176_g7267 [Lecanicillium fungicola]